MNFRGEWDRGESRQARLDAAWDDRQKLEAERAFRANLAKLHANEPDNLYENRHVGTDSGRHHWAQIINGPNFDADGALHTGCDCGCQQAAAEESPDPLEQLARQALDPFEARQLAHDQTRRSLHGQSQRTLDGDEALQILADMRIRFSVADGE